MTDRAEFSEGRPFPEDGTVHDVYSMPVAAAVNGSDSHPGPEGVTDLSSVAAIGQLASVSERRSSEDGERYVVVDGRTLRVEIYRDAPWHKDMTRKVVAGRERRYKEEQIWPEDAEIKDDLVGWDMQVIALVDPKTNDPVASIRLKHGLLRDMPSYIKAVEAGAISAEGQQILDERGMNRRMAEPCALWRDKEYSQATTMVLYKLAAHESARRSEGWVIGAVRWEAAIVKRLFGNRVVRDLGRPFVVHDGNAVEDLELTPLFIDPCTFLGELLDSAEAAKDPARSDDYRLLAWWFKLGLESEFIPPDIRKRFEELSNGSSAAA